MVAGKKDFRIKKVFALIIEKKLIPQGGILNSYNTYFYTMFIREN